MKYILKVKKEQPDLFWVMVFALINITFLIMLMFRL